MTTFEDKWGLVKLVLREARRVLLWGRPATGKTHTACVSQAGERIYYVQVTEETPCAELRGCYVPQGDRFAWQDGPIVAAMRVALTGQPVRLVVDEIDRASQDTATFLLGVCAVPARCSLPTGEVLTLAADIPFHVVGTTNQPPTALMAALASRFPVVVECATTHPDALASLPDDLREHARGMADQADDQRRLDIRVWLEFARLRTTLGDDAALAACFGDRATDIMDVLTLGTREPNA